jgi:hypothetical protein
MGNVQTAASAHEALWRQAPGGELVDLGRPHRAPLGQLRTQKTPKRFSSRREGILLGLLVLALHGAVIYWVSQKATPVLPIVPPEIPPMTIEFSSQRRQWLNLHRLRHHHRRRLWSSHRPLWWMSWLPSRRRKRFRNPSRCQNPCPNRSPNR